MSGPIINNRTHRWSNYRRLTVCAALVVLLSACSDDDDDDDGDGEPPSAAPTVTVEGNTRQLLFDWEPVSGTNSYRLLHNPDGESGFSAITGDLGFTEVGLEVSPHRFDWDAAEFMVEACNRAGCKQSETLTVDEQMLDTIGYFKAFNTDAGDGFGYSVAMSANGSTLAIGAYGEDSATRNINGNPNNNVEGENSGAVYIFVRNRQQWTQQAYIKPGNTGAGDQFGFSVALSANGNTLVVGSPYEDSSSAGGGGQNDDLEDSGAVYLFTRSGDGWSQETLFKANNSGAFDNYGWSVAIDGEGRTLAVGATGEDSADGDSQNDDTAEAAGAVYLYDFSTDDGWEFSRYLKAVTPTAGDNFGFSLALDINGDTLAVGVPYDDGGGDTREDAGAVYVYLEREKEWTLQAYLQASNSEIGDLFGYSVSLSDNGDTLAAGASGEASNATGIDGNEGDNSSPGAGAAYIFTRSEDTWAQQTYLKASNTEESDNFGAAVALSGSGTTLAVGAPLEASAAAGIDGDQTDESEGGAGAAYFFTFADDEWTQQSYVKAINPEQEDGFGTAIALSRNGTLMAIGAPGEDGNDTGTGGEPDNMADDAGAVYLH
ncbi:hypothetical protein FKG94_16885 [Exilibacterium tricleocarpae]|uniref:Integrin n=1 Tax=Exilibacterium tricleocarpae TaxID=2591008 RepID=A0A545TAP9_9GAMM|nr:FG-GAP repeat protein [Exilibacterium tricleocarpae]TQV74278.1 hypothetical protein FKG94_16885 [Exilibacterium tricleocarpae]